MLWNVLALSENGLNSASESYTKFTILLYNNLFSLWHPDSTYFLVVVVRLSLVGECLLTHSRDSESESVINHAAAGLRGHEG